jgi:Tol biopolymer transport system component
MGRPRLRSLLLVTIAVVAFSVSALVLRGLPERTSDGETAPAQTILVYAQFGFSADSVYTAPASDPTRRELVTTVSHADGWGINPAPSMAGTLVAYTVLPSGSGRGEPAELWLFDLASGAGTRLARDADLFVAPLFGPAGDYLVYRSFGPDGEQRLSRVDLATRARRIVHSYSGDFGIFPVAQEAGGDVLFVLLSTAGTDLYRVDGAGEVTMLLHASDEIARDWQLSPDGRLISYLAPVRAGERIVHRLHVASIADGGSLIEADGLSEQFAPVWDASGQALTFGREAYPAATASAATISLADGAITTLAAPQQGFDTPLGWSPDGRYLAARTFDGSSAYAPGAESLVVISVEGERLPVTANSELIFLGWLARG